MATNVYFSPKVKTEQNLYEDLVIESLKMYGQDVVYIPRQLISRDEIMNEDSDYNFDMAELQWLKEEFTESEEINQTVS